MTGTKTTTASTPMSVEDRATFERDGYVIVPGVLTDDEVATAREKMIEDILRSLEKEGGKDAAGEMRPRVESALPTV